MQSNAVNTMLLIPKTLEIGKTATAQGLLPGDDTFMHMLSERIAAGRENSLKNRQMETKRNLPGYNVLRDNFKPVNSSDPKTVSKTHGNESKGITDISKPEAKGKPEVEAIKTESDEKEKIKEQISSLEALIALLEELMARLNNDIVSADPVKSDIPPELITTDTKEISLMELLMALMEGNAEKLKTLINELGDSIQTSEFQELVEKIKSLIERLAKDPDMPELKAEIDGESVSKEELIKQLKAQCGQLIDQLKEQVARLNSVIEEEEAGLQTDSLLAGILTDEGSLNESQNVESETGHEAKDAKDGSAAFAKDADASNVKAGAEVENPFENIIIQNQQMPEKSPGPSESLGKSQIPLSGKPLAHAVTNQVMMKVKLMAGENKQEMEMHLKPDSLGKLSLKIIHERGEILAKITAENEQVKGILESNMQMLKDALEKSGFNVQSLSVSVGNGNGKGQNTESSDGKGKATSMSMGRTTSTSSQVDADKPNLRARIEKEYYSDTSQINLTA